MDERCQDILSLVEHLPNYFEGNRHTVSLCKGGAFENGVKVFLVRTIVHLGILEGGREVSPSCLEVIREIIFGNHFEEFLVNVLKDERKRFFSECFVKKHIEVEAQPTVLAS